MPLDSIAVLSADEVRALIAYDPETGIFTRKVRTSNSVRVGDVAGHSNALGYRQISIHGKLHLAHRLAWLMTHGVWPTGDVDHINGNPSDNRLANLRDVAHADNQKNMKRHRDNTSGHKGVSWSKHYQCWKAQISVDGKNKFIGNFANLADAAQAYRAAAKLHHGEFARDE